MVNLEGTKSGKEYFSDQNISQVYEDSRGLIWIGTCEGLNVYNPKTDELIILGVEQGVSSPIISGIVEDGNENIWVTTARGITNVIPAVDLKTGRYIFIVVFMMTKMVCKIVGSTCVPLKNCLLEKFLWEGCMVLTASVRMI